MKRSDLPDEVFGIPEERKYPMPDKQHTLAAIRLFGHVDPKYEEELAINIIKNMKKYDIPESYVGKDNKLRKYIDKYYYEIKSESCTGGTIVGTSAPDSVRVVNYLQNNTFSGYKQNRYALTTDAFDTIYALPDNELITGEDLEDWKESVTDIHIYKYTGKNKYTLDDIIKESSTLFEAYYMITGIKNVDIDLDADCLFKEDFTAYNGRESVVGTCIEATREFSGNLYVPVLEYSVSGRYYNFYRDENGIFARNNLYGIRTESFDDVDSCIRSSQFKYICEK